MSRKIVLRSLALMSLLICSLVEAEVHQGQIKLDGSGNYARIKLERGKANKVILWAVSPGKESTVLTADITAPKGAMVKTTATRITRTVKEALSNLKAHYPLDLYTSGVHNARHSECHGIEVPLEDLKASDFAPSWSDTCTLFTQEELQALVDQFNLSYGGGWTIGHVCTYLTQTIGDVDWDGELPGFGRMARAYAREDDPFVDTYDLTGLFKKDMCSTRKTDRYLVRIEVDFKKVDPASAPDGVMVFSSVMESRYQGSRSASLKPKSDGRYAPKPIVLMDYMRKMCGNRVVISKWKDGKPKKLADHASYGFIRRNGSLFTRTLVDGGLKGGKGVFDLYDGSNAYGVCFELVAKRQNKNGYR